MTLRSWPNDMALSSCPGGRGSMIGSYAQDLEVVAQ